jgi:peroxiredoxin
MLHLLLHLIFPPSLPPSLPPSPPIPHTQQDQDHTAFVEKYGLQMQLLSDVGGATRKAYNVPTSLFGALEGRVTYVIGKDLTIKLVYDNQFSPESHVEKSLVALA